MQSKVQDTRQKSKHFGSISCLDESKSRHCSQKICCVWSGEILPTAPGNTTLRVKHPSDLINLTKQLNDRMRSFVSHIGTSMSSSHAVLPLRSKHSAEFSNLLDFNNCIKVSLNYI